MINGLIGFLPIWMFIDFAITGWNPNILGYKLIGEIVPDVRMTEGNDVLFGFILS